MRYRWIGLCGKMAVGKDYTYNVLREEWERISIFPGGPTRVSFADQVRIEMDRTLRPSNLDLFWDKPYSTEVRKLMQWWGTDLRRAEDPLYWVKRGEAQGLQVGQQGFTPVFTDVRFPNEADMILDHDGLLICLTASTVVRERRLGGPAADHESETAMDNYRWPDDTVHLSGEEDTDLYRGWLRKVLEWTT